MLNRFVIYALVGGVGLARAGMTQAQTSVPAPPSDVSGQGGSLSQKLNATNGVIHPQGAIDPEMQKAPPQTGSTPVVPPPGSPGGPTNATPK
jgi:hypothetical protein